MLKYLPYTINYDGRSYFVSGVAEANASKIRNFARVGNLGDKYKICFI